MIGYNKHHDRLFEVRVFTGLNERTFYLARPIFRRDKCGDLESS
jgi:hypothetical protein